MQALTVAHAHTHAHTHVSANLIYYTGRSNALNIAERLGLDPAIVAAARKRLGTGAGAADAASVALEAARAQADAADAAAFTAAADLDAARVRAAAAAAAAAGAGSFVPVCSAQCIAAVVTALHQMYYSVWYRSRHHHVLANQLSKLLSMITCKMTLQLPISLLPTPCAHTAAPCRGP
jgi:hypothetical protein